MAGHTQRWRSKVVWAAMFKQTADQLLTTHLCAWRSSNLQESRNYWHQPCCAGSPDWFYALRSCMTLAASL